MTSATITLVPGSVRPIGTGQAEFTAPPAPLFAQLQVYLSIVVVIGDYARERDPQRLGVEGIENAGRVLLENSSLDAFDCAARQTSFDSDDLLTMFLP